MQLVNETDKTTEFGKRLFFAAYFILLMRAFLQNSTIAVYLHVDSLFYRYFIRLIAYVLIAVKIFFCDEYSRKVFCAYIVLALVFTLSVYFNRYLAVLEIILLAVGAHGLNLKAIVKEYFYIAVIMCASLAALSLCGVIENHIAYAGDIPRYSFGSVYPTDFAASLFYIQLSHAYLRKKDYSFFTFAFWVLVSLFVLKFCRARLNFALILFFSVFMYLKTLLPKVLKISFIKSVFVWAIPAFLVLSLVLHYAYSGNSSLLSWLDGKLSGRLYYGNRAIADYGFSIFGKNVKMQGWGFSQEEWDAELGYYFIDSGWLSMTIRYGILMTVLICGSFMVASRNAFRSGDYTLPIILLFLAITSIVDHHVLEIGYNPFLVLIGFAVRQVFARKRQGEMRASLKCKNNLNLS